MIIARLTTILLLASSIILVSAQCRKAKDRGPEPSSNDATPPTEWDGASDWHASTMEIVEE